MTFAGLSVWAVGAMVLASAGVLAVLHLLRVRPREVRVVTTLFWVHAVERTRARTLWERFRHPWTYGLLLLICTLLSLALGQPRRTTEPPDRIWAAIVVDAGAPMGASFGEARTSYFDAAKEAAREAIGRLSANDRLAVIVADPWPRLVHRFDDPRPLAARRLDEAAVAKAPAALGEAVKLAQSLLNGRDRARIVLITNRPEMPDRPSMRNEPADVQFIRVGAPADNAAVLSAVFEPAPDNPLRGRFTVRVGYWGDRPREVRLRIQRAGGAPLLDEAYTIAPGSTQDFTIANLPADGDALQVRLEPPDAMAADDQAVFRLPFRTPIRVGFVGAVPEVLRLALESDSAVHPAKDGGPRDIDVVAGTSQHDLTRPCIVVVGSGTPAPAGRPVRAASDSPFIRDLDWEGAACGTGAAVDADANGATPLLAADNAILAVFASGMGRPRLLIGSTLLAEDATANRRPAFAVFLARATRRLAGWSDDPVVLPPERPIEDPLWCTRERLGGNVVVMPAGRDAGLFAMKEPDSTVPRQAGPAARMAFPEPFELLLYAAMACFVFEAVLHARGRIS